MNKILPTFFLSLVFVGCSQNGGDDKPSVKKESLKEKVAATPAVTDTTPKVTGVGGVFIISEDPASTRDWYAKNLGFAMTPYGTSFEFRNVNSPENVGMLQWTPIKKGDAYFVPSKKDFMINYRVQNIEGLVRKLKANGVTILDTMAAYDYGKFIHIMDADGNKIELWEPIDEIRK